MRKAWWMLAFLLLVGGCAARGNEPAVVEHAVAVPAPRMSEAPRGSLRVATINMWGVVIPALEFPIASEIDLRFEALAERLAANREDLDVVLIQEAWAKGARRRLLADADVAREFPYRVDAVRSPGGSGLVTLSRLPLDEETVFLRFSEQGCCLKIHEGDCIAGKGMLAVKVRLGRHRAWIANTHLIACYSSGGESACDRGDANGETRRAQTLELVGALSDLPGADPLLLAGDFNFTRTSVYYPLMGAAGWRDHGEANAPGDRIDYVWSRPGAELLWRGRGPAERIFTELVPTSEGEAVELSDHPAIAQTLCLVRPEDPDRCLLFEGAARSASSR